MSRHALPDDQRTTIRLSPLPWLAALAVFASVTALSGYLAATERNLWWWAMAVAAAACWTAWPGWRLEIATRGRYR